MYVIVVVVGMMMVEVVVVEEGVNDGNIVVGGRVRLGVGRAGDRLQGGHFRILQVFIIIVVGTAVAAVVDKNIMHLDIFIYIGIGCAAIVVVVVVVIGIVGMVDIVVI